MLIADRKRCSLSHIMENYTAHEIEYWKVYYSKEPTTAKRNEYYFTQLISLMYNYMSKNKKAPSEFLYPETWKTEEQQDVDLIRQMFGSNL